MASGIEERPSVQVLTVRVDDAWAHAAIEAMGLRVLRVRHPLPACERIRVTKPVVVVIGGTVREADVELVERAASEVGATIVAAPSASDDRLVREVRRAVDAALAYRAAWAGAAHGA